MKSNNFFNISKSKQKPTAQDHQNNLVINKPKIKIPNFIKDLK